MTKSKSRARPDLPFHAGGQGNRDPGGNAGAPARRDDDRLIGGYCSNEIEPGGQFAVIGR
jgi:hypothetical protein